MITFLLITLFVAFVNGQSFQLAASSEAAFVPASSMDRVPHPPVSPLKRDSSGTYQSTAPLPLGEVKRRFQWGGKKGKYRGWTQQMEFMGG